jgi:hypothetical protein
LETTIMKTRRTVQLAALCGTLVLTVSFAARLGDFGSSIVETTAAVPLDHPPAAIITAEAERNAAPPVSAMGTAVLDSIDVATAAEPEAVMTADSVAVLDEPVIVEASLHELSVMPEPESTPVEAAPAGTSDAVPENVRKTTDTTEILGECLVADVCIDRYLWALYQRTAKEDSLRVHERRKVTIRRKGKMVTVTRSFTKLVDQDFTWKDPKAAERVGMPMMDYVIGGMDRRFKTKLFHTLHAAEQAGLSPGITSAFRDDYRQSIASGMKAATDMSYHGGSFRGGYGHGLAADVVSVEGATRNQRWASTEKFWKWIDAHGKEFGIGRPYLGRDPPHVAPTDGREYAAHNPGMRAHAQADVKKPTRLAARDNAAKVPAKRKVVQGAARQAKHGKVADRPKMAMAEPGRG